MNLHYKVNLIFCNVYLFQNAFTCGNSISFRDKNCEIVDMSKVKSVGMMKNHVRKIQCTVRGVSVALCFLNFGTGWTFDTIFIF